MNEVIMWIIIGVVLAVILGVIIYFIVKIATMSTEQKKELLLNFLKGAVVAAEEYIGSGNGEEKLAYVEDYFKKHASWFLKILLAISGKNSLKDLIELALSAVKTSFGSKKKNDNDSSEEKEE